MKFLIFDSGPIISMTMSGLIGVLENLKKIFNGAFIITPQVKFELIDRPFNIKKYKLESIFVKNLLSRGVLELSTKYVSDNLLEKEALKIMKISNSILRCKSTNEKINLIHRGEASCLAFAKLCNCDNVIVIDERTTRLIVESPGNLREAMERKLHTKIILDKSNLMKIDKFKIIRSPELVFAAFKKGLIPLKKDKQTLDALLYSLKFKGTSISSQEIEELKMLL